MRTYTDQTGYEIGLDGLPLRIVSLVPSQTELLFDLGLNEEVVGVTTYCLHPEPKIRTKTKVGGTKNPDIDLIHSLKPTLIIGNKEENTREVVELLRDEYPVWLSDVNNLAEATSMIRSLGEIVGKEPTANWIADKINERFLIFSGELAERGAARPAGPPQVAYFIWRKPWMVAGGGTFIHSMLEAAGYLNVFADTPRYPTFSQEELRRYAPNQVLLSTEPYPFKQKHLAELREIFPKATIRLVDGELFSWYGSRLLRTPDYLRQLRALLP
ncbi:helical backbone metal receptor [Telluribacter sp.]|jgi:ABC-type Fe3+-hydroxamate transport system substrate-binding protein|uniref:helical backbone metal receptor n=1 Tax=Telluribacter sp. TaxID=1978767 RepID=UPI002E0EF137|nr:helical backbone metal receptor [Telluribacter sp.]